MSSITFSSISVVDASLTAVATSGTLGSSTLPTYTAPVIGGATEEITATMDADSAGYGTDADWLNFSKWFSVAGKLIEDEEDTELASAKASEINLRFKRALDQFNSEVQTYKVENEGEIAHYSSEISAYSAEVNAEVTEQTATLQTETARYQWLQERQTTYWSEYLSAFGVTASEE